MHTACCIVYEPERETKALDNRTQHFQHGVLATNWLCRQLTTHLLSRSIRRIQYGEDVIWGECIDRWGGYGWIVIEKKWWNGSYWEGERERGGRGEGKGRAGKFVLWMSNSTLFFNFSILSIHDVPVIYLFICFSENISRQKGKARILRENTYIKKR